MGDTKINYDEQFGMNTFRREICAALGESFWETLTDGLILPDIETEGAFQCANMCAFMKRLENMADKETVRSILCKVRHGLHPSQSSWAHDEFAGNRPIRTLVPRRRGTRREPETRPVSQRWTRNRLSEKRRK